LDKLICIAGKNNITVNVLEFAVNKYGMGNVVFVANRNDNGKDSWQKSAKLYCERQGIKEVTLEDVYRIENLYFFSTEFDRIIRPHKFASDNLFNVHFSLLPKYKGMYTSVMPILHGEKETGVTFHKIRAGIDTGEIIDQQKFLIKDDMTSLDIYEVLINLGSQIVIDNMDKVLRGEFELKSQPACGSEYFSKAAIDYSTLSLDVNATAYQIRNQIRAFAFRPYQLLTMNGTGLIGCDYTDEVSEDKPGTILSEDELTFKIATIDYNAILYKDVLKELIDAIIAKDNDRAKMLCAYKKIAGEHLPNGWSPLIVAVYNNNIEMVHFLIDECGADINVRSFNGTNLLMYAKDAWKNTGDDSLFEYFLKKGLTPELEDNKGKNLRDYCREEGIDSIAGVSFK